MFITSDHPLSSAHPSLSGTFSEKPLIGGYHATLCRSRSHWRGRITSFAGPLALRLSPLHRQLGILISLIVEGQKRSRSSISVCALGEYLDSKGQIVRFPMIIISIDGCILTIPCEQSYKSLIKRQNSRLPSTLDHLSTIVEKFWGSDKKLCLIGRCGNVGLT